MAAQNMKAETMDTSVLREFLVFLPLFFFFAMIRTEDPHYWPGLILEKIFQV